jgi:hypothetical protein
LELAEARDEVDGWLALKLIGGRCSDLLRNQLAACIVGRTYNVFTIYDRIAELEVGDKDAHPSRTKPAAQFTGAVLGGLWHAHFTSPRFLVQNIVNHWGARKSAQKYKELCAALDQTGDVGRFAYECVIGGNEARSAAYAQTGEWIVYVKAGGANFYLTLATHTEGDPDIYARAQS